MDRPVICVKIEEDGGALLTIERPAGDPLAAPVKLTREARDQLILELVNPGPIPGWARIGGLHAPTD